MWSERGLESHRSGEYFFFSSSILPAPALQEPQLEEKERRKSECVASVFSPLQKEALLVVWGRAKTSIQLDMHLKFEVKLNWTFLVVEIGLRLSFQEHHPKSWHRNGLIKKCHYHLRHRELHCVGPTKTVNAPQSQMSLPSPKPTKWWHWTWLISCSSLRNFNLAEVCLMSGI